MRANNKIRVGLYLLFIIGFFSASAAASELGDLCWLDSKGGLLRFSVTQSGTNHYTYTGQFDDDGTGAYYALMGEVEVSTSGSITGSFNGSKTTASYFRTGIWLVNFSQSLTTGNVTGIRQTYPLTNGVDMGGAVVTDYHTTTVTSTTCP